MYNETFRSAILLIAACWLTASASARSQEAADGPPGDLYEQIAEMDRVLFDAFNTRDLETTKKIFAEDLEFFHDNDGLAGYAKTIESLASLFAQNNDLHRELVEGSMEVFPVPGYGAMQFGEHRFCHTENGKPDCGTFRFAHVWRREGEAWKLARVLSYGHRPPPAPGKAK